MSECSFCSPSLVDGAVDRTGRCYAIWTEDEPPEGGAMVLPIAHRESQFDLTLEEWEDTRQLLARMRTLVDQRVRPDGYNVGWNVLPAGGQRIPHVHCHLVPRFADERHAGKGIRWWIKQPDNTRDSR